jgi:hypothetical protein
MSDTPSKRIKLTGHLYYRVSYCDSIGYFPLPFNSILL